MFAFNTIGVSFGVERLSRYSMISNIYLFVTIDNLNNYY